MTQIQTPQKLNTLSKPHPIYRNIIFDLGRVLIDWNPTRIAAQAFAKNPSQGFDLEKIFKKHPETFNQLWNDWDRGIISQQELIAQSATFLNQDALTKFIDAMIPSLVPLESGVKILEAVKTRGFNAYILSNFAKEPFETVSTQYDFFKLFDGGIISYKVNLAKPDPAIYLKLLETYNLKAEESIFIDDLEKNIIGGRTAGIEGIVCCDHETVAGELRRLGVL